MSHSSKIFEEQPIRVQNLNGFDLSHMSSGTAYCGTLTPVLSRLTMQGMKFSLGCALQVELPPLSTQAFGRIDANIEVFWTPCSILYGGWKQFIANNPETSFILSQANYEKYDLPYIAFDNDNVLQAKLASLDNSNYCLLDYLGCQAGASVLGLSTRGFKILSLLNYHKVWDVFYRNPQVTRTIFAVNPDTTGPGFSHNVAFIHHSYYSSLVTGSSPRFDTDTDTTFPDGISILSLRQRNYGNDYFTAGSLDPQQGNPATVAFTVDLNTGDGEFSIPALRMSNAIQRFYELANYSPEYRSIMRANFGFTPGDAGYDEPVYLGRLVVPVYQKGVYLQGAAGSGGDSDPSYNGSNNPFLNGNLGGNLGVVGAKAAAGSFNGSGEIVSNFKCKSWGYLLGLFSLTPHAQYSYGIDKDFLRLGVGEHPFPVLQSVGMDAVKSYEVFASAANINGDTDFSYLPRYSYDKYINDTVHGELRPGKLLSSFIIQRSFASAPSFNTAFLEIGIRDLDPILSVASTSALFTCWYECFWVFKAVMPLAEFCVPTLGDLQDTHEIKVKQGGSRL